MGRYSPIKQVSRIRQNATSGVRMYVGNKYPQIPLTQEDTYIFAEEGDRFDTLAQQYYGDSSMWWVISIANESLKQNSYYLPLGVQIRIPSNIASIMADYTKLNNRNDRL
jgi:phage tail protein X